jgi:ankyrin repeat protein
VKRTLRTLPKTLDETYERILLGVPLEHQQEAISALTWLVLTKRPLSIKELAEASVIDIASTTNKPFDTNERLLDPESILTTLSGLVSVTKAASFPYEEIIRLAHFSVEEYLVSERITNSPASPFHLSYTSSPRSLASGCLYYLQCPDMPTVNGYDFRITFPFFKYAAEYWSAHVKDCDGSTPDWLLDVMWSFFTSEYSFVIWEKACYDLNPIHADVDYIAYNAREQHDHWTLSRGIWGSMKSICSTPFRYACRFGLTDVVQRFLDLEASSEDAACEDGRTYVNELCIACYFSQEVIVFKLLDSGADQTTAEEPLRAVLDAAMHSKSPNEQILCRLLELSGQLSASSPLTGSIMRRAVETGSLRIASLLLEKVDDLDRKFEWTKLSNTLVQAGRTTSYRNDCTAPYEAAFRGHFDVLQKLIGNWGYVDEADREGRTALYWAAFHGHGQIVKLLLDNGASANISIRGYGWKPIDWAKDRGDLNMVELLEKGAQDELD